MVKDDDTITGGQRVAAHPGDVGLPALFFVYGTLKRGHHNNMVLQTSRFMGAATTVDKLALKIDGLPYLIDQPSEFQVDGEVFSVRSAEVASNLDRLEGHPHFYQRRQIDVKLNGTGKIVKCWTYFVVRDSTIARLSSEPNHRSYARRS